MCTTHCVTDTDTGANMLLEDLFWSAWLISMRLYDNAKLKRAFNQRVQVGRLSVLHTKVGKSRLLIKPEIIRNVIVYVLFSVSALDEFVNCVLPADRKIVVINSSLVLTLTFHNAEPNKTEAT